MPSETRYNLCSSKTLIETKNSRATSPIRHKSVTTVPALFVYFCLYALYSLQASMA